MLLTKLIDEGNRRCFERCGGFFSPARPLYAHPRRHISQQQQRPLHLVQTVSCVPEVSADGCQSSADAVRVKEMMSFCLRKRESFICHGFIFFSIGGVALVSISSMDNDKGVTGNHGFSELSVRI